MEYLTKLSKDTLSRLRKEYSKVGIHTLEDCVQDCLLKYLQKYGNLDNITPQWLWTACRNRLIDIHRHEQRSTPGVPETITEGDGPALVDIALDSQREAIKSAAKTLAYPE